MDLEKAIRFIWENARLLDRLIFEQRFYHGPASRVRELVRTYQNPDGGFGHAIEPDLRVPDSQPLFVEFALHTLYECGIRVLKNYTGKIDGLFSHNDDMAIGAIQAIQEAGLTPGKDVMVLGLDATKDGFAALIDGTLGADIECNPLLGPQVYEVALKGLNGDATAPSFIPSNEGEFYAFRVRMLSRLSCHTANTKGGSKCRASPGWSVRIAL